LKGLLANLLNLNPIVSMDADGNSMVFGKTFSQKANMKKVMAQINRTSRDRPIWNHIVMHANNRPAADWYARQMTALTASPRWLRSTSHRSSAPVPDWAPPLWPSCSIDPFLSRSGAPQQRLRHCCISSYYKLPGLG
jgi:hypothetical protein